MDAADGLDDADDVTPPKAAKPGRANARRPAKAAKPAVAASQTGIRQSARGRVANKQILGGDYAVPSSVISRSSGLVLVDDDDEDDDDEEDDEDDEDDEDSFLEFLFFLVTFYPVSNFTFALLTDVNYFCCPIFCFWFLTRSFLFAEFIVQWMTCFVVVRS